MIGMSSPKTIRAVVAFFSFALVSFACQTAPPRRSSAPPPARPVVAKRVVLISLDGVGAVELRERWRAGEFGPGGFDRFFREGAVAEALLPVEPTLTAVNHITLATGFPPRSTGIVSNRFHRAGTPWLNSVSGFAVPIETETLWEAARRQGKRTAVLTFPGADAAEAADGADPRRRADFGLAYSGVAAAPSEIVAEPRNLSEGEWRADFESLPNGQAGVRWVTQLSGGRLYRGALYPTLAYPLAFLAELTEGQAEDQAPDTSNTTSGQSAGTSTRPLLWPGPPDDRRLDAVLFGGGDSQGFEVEHWTAQAERFSTFFFDVFRFVVQRGGWELLLGYVPTIDEVEHKLLLVDPRQPGFTVERSAELAAMRRRVWRRVDSELASFLGQLDLRTTTVFVVSDHGMLPIHTRIQAREVLAAAGLSRRPGTELEDDSGSGAIVWSDSGVAHVYFSPQLGVEARRAASEDLERRFSALSAHGEPAIDKILRHDDLAEHGLDHPNSGDLVIFAAPGFTFDPDPLPGGATVAPTDVLGMHGHRRGPPRLDAAYLELGVGVKRGVIPALSTLEVAGRVARRLGIEPPVRSLESLRPSP